MEITTIGGGTGTTAVLTALKPYKDIHLNAIVSMMDDGGSNAIVRDEFGLLPLSDLRKAIIALSEHNKNELVREIFNYRFSHGEGISGHTLGNLMMIALSDITGGEDKALEALEEIFDIVGDIIPVTLDKVRLVAKYDNGKKIVGEHLIDTSNIKGKIENISLSNNAKATKEAIEAIKKSEYIVIGPGDLYTSIIPNILVDGISKSLRKAKGKIVIISNLMTKQGETHWMKISDFVQEIEKYTGRKADYIIINSEKIPEHLIEKYAKENQHQFEDDLSDKDKRVILVDILSKKVVKKDKGDNLPRSFIRYDNERLGEELYSLFRKESYSAISRIIDLFNISKS